MNNKISVIIPVYNVEDYISRCIESVIQNTYKNLEIICIDDGSTDNSNKILNSFAEADTRIKIIKKCNGGVSSARNIGLENCTGDFISFIDSDDWVHPLYFETLLKIQSEYNSDIVIPNRKAVSQTCDFEIFTTENIKIDNLTLDQVYVDHTIKSFVTGRLYRRNILNGFTFSEEIVVLEDAIFNALVMCSTTLTITYIPVILYYYFSRPTSLMHQINVLNFVQISKLYFEYSLTYNSKRAKKIFLIETIKRSLFTRYALSLTPKYKSHKKECTNILKKAIRQLISLDYISTKDKLKYYILYKFPQAYRIYRIIGDPTLLEWEKEQKKL